MSTTTHSSFLAPLIELGPLLGTFEHHGAKNRIQFHHGGLYEGELNHGEMHGHGHFCWSNGVEYQGDFVHNRMQGVGQLNWNEPKAEYIGEFKDNVKHGKGRLTFAKGITYDGDWHQGKPHGKGTMTWSPTVYYQGDFVEGRRHGHGEMHYASGSVYIGQWEQGVKHGYGALQWNSGDRYEGYWEHGRIHGVGHYVWNTLRNTDFYSAKNEYEGEFQRGQRHGKGVFKYADGSYYKGYFKNNKKESEEGIYKDFTGNVHKGKFSSDQLKPRQYMTGPPDWQIKQPALQTELRRHFRYLLHHFRIYKSCFPYPDLSSFTRDQFWYLLFPFRQAKFQLYQLDIQLTHHLKLNLPGSANDIVPFDLYLKFMLNYPECWKRLESPDPTFVQLYASFKHLLHAIFHRSSTPIHLHQVVIWLYQCNPTSKLTMCIRSVVKGIPWLMQDQAVFLDYPIVSLEFLQCIYFFYCTLLRTDSDIPYQTLEKKVGEFLDWVLTLEE